MYNMCGRMLLEAIRRDTLSASTASNILLGYCNEFDETTNSLIFMHHWKSTTGTKSSITTASWSHSSFLHKKQAFTEKLHKEFSYLLRPKFTRLL